MNYFISQIKNLNDFYQFYHSNIWREDSTLAEELRVKLTELLAAFSDADVSESNKQVLIELNKVVADTEDSDEGWILHNEWTQRGGAQLPAETPLDLNEFCTLSEEYTQDLKKFSTTGKVFVATFKNLHEMDNLEELLSSLFQHLLDQTQAKNNDLVGFEIRHSALDRPILIPYKKKNEITVEHIIRTIANVVQSNTELEMEEGLECQVTHIVTPSGRGWTRCRYDGDLEAFLKKHKSVINVCSEDNLCLPSALVVSMALVNNDPKLRMIREFSRFKIQKKLALKLMEDVGLSEHTAAWGIEEVKIFQNFLSPEYQIKVFDKSDCDSIIFDGPSAPKQLNLFLTNSHYFVISKILAFLNTSYWCSDCNKRYKNRFDHATCPVKCSRCFHKSICLVDHLKKCNTCNRWFANEECFRQHNDVPYVPTGNSKRKRGLSICEQWKRCNSCGKEYRHNIKHECSKIYCHICRCDVEKTSGHQCYMPNFQPNARKESSFIFFDFETQQTNPIRDTHLGSVFLHEVICCIVHKVCDKCWKEPCMDLHCDFCGQRKLVFVGETSLEQFVRWLFSETNRDCIAIAHNGKSYDFQFILEKLHKNAAAKPNIITKGLEILKLSQSGVTLLDSINFLPMPLSSMPKAFNLKELKKGFFPHLFSSPEHMNYIGPIPDAYFYSPASMKQSKKVEFFKWYFGSKHNVFDFRKELVEYCNSDVDILKQACMNFRFQFINTNQLDPFNNAITVADACNKVYRMLYLPEKTIGLIPHGDYRVDQRYSNIAIKWMRWLSFTKNIRIEHACNGREFRIQVNHQRSLKVDGRHENDIYEFHGCAFHGCLKCFKSHTFLPLTGLSVRETYQATMDREVLIKEKGYNLITMWECELKRNLKLNPEMKLFFSQQKLVDPMNARESFYGGRTNCIKLYHETKGDERIESIDVCSLYPYVLKYGIFPIDHPIIITEQFESLNNQPYLGLIHCRVLPPKKLFHPVLPTRVRGKLLFPLCHTCALNILPGPCEHSDEERSFWGCWVTLELYKSLELGYKVLEIAEVWHYPKTRQYKPEESSSSGLFTEYINMFLKVKQEASDWPDWCRTEEDRHKYLLDYKEHEMIDLDPVNITKNPAMRALAKLCLNSFFGKFGQRPNKPKTVYCNSPDKFFEIISDPSLEIKHIQFVSDEKVLINYINVEGFEETLSNTNVVIAAFVTAQARLKLYSYLEILQQQVLYFDTDSVFYISKPTMPKIPTGDHLGEMTNELSKFGKDAKINKFCSCGPKNYSYRVISEGKTSFCTKIRGFTLSTTAGKRLNLKTMQKRVFAYVKGEFCPKIDIVSWKIDKTEERHVVSRPQKKSYDLVIDKRYCDKNFMTYPFGY